MSIELSVPGGGPSILHKDTNGSSPSLSATDSRQINGRLAAGTYTVAVAMNAPNGNGHGFSLDIKQGPDTPTPQDACESYLGALPRRFTEQWSSVCGWLARPGLHSRWYTFEIPGSSGRITVDIALDADTAVEPRLLAPNC